MAHDLAIISGLPDGSTVLLRRKFGIATFERTRALSGPQSKTYGEHAIILTQGPIYGQVTLNGLLTRSGSNGRPLCSVLQPGDHVAGVLEKSASYDTLLLSTPFVDGFLAEKYGSSTGVLTSKLLVEAPRFMQSVWSRMSDLVDEQVADVEPLITVCIELLLLNLIEELGGPGPIIARQHSEALTRAVKFIEHHLGETIDLRLIARIAGLSPSHFNRVFKARHHVSVHRFVLMRRLERVRHLLRETNQPIAVVALEAGFCSQSHLTTAFRQRYAMTPAQYRIDSRRRHFRKDA